MSDQTRRTVLLPIETKVREFHGKLLLAAVAAEAGFDVVLGEQRAMLRAIRRLPKGIYIDKSVVRNRISKFRRLRGLGHRVMAWCEEGLVFRDRDTYLHERISVASLDQTDTFFAWGEVQAEAVLRKAPHAAEKVMRSGNPRFDVLRPGIRNVFANEAQRLRETYGRFILVNTNFSRFNHFNGRDYVIDVLKRRGTIKTAEQEAFFRRWGDYLGILNREFVTLLPELSAAFPKHTIVVRPHPSENHAVWARDVRDLPNVKVIHEGSAIPWILAADLLVHNSCTTGVEAYLLECPVVTYRPVTDEVLDSHLPNAVSYEASDRATLIDVIKASVAGEQINNPEMDHRRRECARRYIASLDGPLAAERVVKTLRDGEVETDLRGPSMASSLTQAVEDIARPPLSGLRRVLPGSRRNRAYARQKFSGIELGEVKAALDDLKLATGRFANVEARPVRGNCSYFLIKGDPL